MCRLKADWKRCVEFHGHECPGLAIGFKACEAAKKKMNLDFTKDEEVVCVTENDACGVDAVQVLTGCTFGKGNLIYKGTGKMAFSFFCRNTNNSIRMILKPLNKEMEREELKLYMLNEDIDKLFEFSIPKFEVPTKAKIFNTVICEECGEGAPEHKIRIKDGKKVCLDCAEDYTRRF